MNVQRHYDDERLIEFLESERDLRRDAHLAGCSSCREALEAYRSITGVLRESSAWETPRPDPRSDATLASLRSIAASMKDDERAAAAMIDEIAALPRQWWAMKVAAESRFQTPALARALTEKSETAIDAMPPDAVELARAATIAADAAGDGQIRGAAYRQFAYALFYTGDIPGSLEAIDRSAEALASCPSSDYELARLDIVRSVVFAAEEQYDKALLAARNARSSFKAFGDSRREVSAVLAESYALLLQLRYREALPVLLAVDRDYRTLIDADSLARVTANIALCQWQTGNVAEALRMYGLAAALYENVPTENARIRLNIAGLLSSQGRQVEAKSTLRDLRDEFQSHGMLFEMVFAGVVLSEILLAEGEYDEVQYLCRSAIVVFENSGHVHQSQVLTALSYLQEAAALRRATPETAKIVHRYFERLPQRPNLLFVSPPLAPE